MSSDCRKRKHENTAARVREIGTNGFKSALHPGKWSPSPGQIKTEQLHGSGCEFAHLLTKICSGLGEDAGGVGPSLDNLELRQTRISAILTYCSTHIDNTTSTVSRNANTAIIDLESCALRRSVTEVARLRPATGHPGCNQPPHQPVTRRPEKNG